MNTWNSWLESDPVPDGSIYMWMYRAGLHMLPQDILFDLLSRSGKEVRQKDRDNYNRGLRNSYFSGRTDPGCSGPKNYLVIGDSTPVQSFTALTLDSFPVSQELRDWEDRWVPCNAENKPMIQWGVKGMKREEAMHYQDAVYLAENLKDTPFIVLDIDGDHNDVLNLELINEFYPLINSTHSLYKPRTVEAFLMEGSERYSPIWDAPTSFHLMYYTDRVIPTKHFTAAHIDLLGNKQNQLRYRKNKIWNGVFPQPLTEEVWRYLMRWVRLMDMRSKRI